jgi:hypothetical protein
VGQDVDGDGLIDGLGRVIKLVLEYQSIFEVSFRPERSGVEESASLPVLSASVEKRVSPLRLSR